MNNYIQTQPTPEFEILAFSFDLSVISATDPILKCRLWIIQISNTGLHPSLLTILYIVEATIKISMELVMNLN